MRHVFVFFLLSAFFSSTLLASAKRKWSCLGSLRAELHSISQIKSELEVFRALSLKRRQGIESEHLVLKPLEAGDQAAMEALIYAGAPGYFLESTPEKNAPAWLLFSAGLCRAKFRAKAQRLRFMIKRHKN